MKVGLIGLGRMGEGMSRRMIKAGIEVHGYRNNVKKAEEQYEKGYISGYTTSLESLVQVVKQRGPGIFQLVIPAETVEDTLNELLPLLGDGDIIIDHGNSNFKDSRKRAERLAKLGIQFIDCGTSGGVFGLERGYCLMVGGTNTAVSVCAPIFRLAPGIGSAHRTNPLSHETSAENGWLHCGPPGAGHFVKMVHNGVEYGIMQAYAEGFNILHGNNAGAAFALKRAMLRWLRWRIRKITAMILTLLRWLSCGVVVAWLAVGYWILLRMYFEAIQSLVISMEGYPIAVRVAGLFMPLSIWVYPLLSFLRRCLSVLNLVDWALLPSKY